jgi:hypothetical protein
MSAATRGVGVKRRSALGLLAAVLTAGCVDSWPRPTGPRGPPPSPERPSGQQDAVRIGEWDYGEGESGRLRVFGTVRNERDGTVESTVLVSVRAGEEEVERSQTVSVPGNGSADFDIEFDVTYEKFRSDGSIRVDLQ